MSEAFLFTAGTDFGYCMYIIANEKFMDVFVRAPTKSQVPAPLVGKSRRRLENCRALFYAVCVSTTNRSCLTLHDVINYNYVTPALSPYECERNIRFTGV